MDIANNNVVSSFKVPGHSLKREWSVYLVVATKHDNPNFKYLYVGKVGDNNKGCNPIFSRAGNHFSHTKAHSQLRNKIEELLNCKPELFDFEFFYVHLYEYDCKKNKSGYLSKINEFERKLYEMVKELIKDKVDKFCLLETGIGKPKDLLSSFEINILQELINKALI